MRSILVCILSLLLFISCTDSFKDQWKEKDSAESIDLAGSIVSTPAQTLKTTASITLIFNQSMVPEHFKDKVLDQSPFKFKPAIQGEARWVDPSTLTFKPAEALPPGVSYTGKLIGSRALPGKTGSDFTFSFKTAEQDINTFDWSFKPADGAPHQVRLQAGIEFAQKVDPEKLNNDLKGTINSKPLKLRAETADDGRHAYEIISEPVQRGERVQYVTLKLPSDYTADNKPWSQTLILPEAHTFKVITHTHKSQPGDELKTYGFRFSDPIAKDRDLSGYVSIDPAVDYELSLSDNYLLLKGKFIPGREYVIHIRKGFKSALNTQLQNDYKAAFRLANQKPKIEWLSEGVFLPPANDYRLQFKSINVGKMRVEVHEIFPQNQGFFLQNNMLGGDQKRYVNDLNRVAEQIYNKELHLDAERNTWMRGELDLSPVFSDKTNAMFVVTCQFNRDDLVGRPTNNENSVSADELYYPDTGYYDNPDRYGYYRENGTRLKVLISSNIGLSLKKADDGLHLYAAELSDAKPVSGLTLTLYTYQNKALQTRQTDKDGHAHFTADDGYYIKGVNDQGIAVIKLNQSGWETSTFDVSGVSRGQDGINPFIYTDRGVYRPGDTIHLSAILRTNTETPPAQQPILLKVFNPHNQMTHELKTQSGEFGHCSFELSTPPGAPTGNWRAELEFAGQTFTHWLKIERLSPNRLKVNLMLPDTVTGRPPVLNGNVTSQYLFGAPASRLRVQVEASLSQASFSVPGYEHYSFTDEEDRFSPREHTLLSDTLNEQGTINFDYTFSQSVQQAKLVRAHVNATVYERGGGFTREQQSMLIKPVDSVVGIRRPDSQYLRTGQDYEFPVIVTTFDGQPVSGHNLRVSHYINRNYWWWEYYRNRDKTFRKLDNTFEVESKTLKSATNPLAFRTLVDEEGLHMIRVEDLQTGQSASVTFSASQWGRQAQPDEQTDQPFLNLTLNQDRFAPGDKAELSFTTPDKGLYLFTLEQDERILLQKVGSVDKERTKIGFKITQDMIPNCYASLSLIQPHEHKDNDLPRRIFGIQPVFVESPQTRLNVRMTAPETVRPGESFRIDIANPNRKAISATLAIVDEGLLNLTDFTTPDPWEHYFKKLRLGVTTLDTWDEILGVLLPDMNVYFSIGGGYAEAMAKRAGAGLAELENIQRFKPVVFFKGPFSIKPGKTKALSFDMHNTIGSVRAMLTACSGHAYAAQDADIRVKSPLMVLPTIPRFARPGDKFYVPVTVFAHDENIRNVTVECRTSDLLNIRDSTRKSLTFKGTGEKDVIFDIQADERIGGSELTVQAESGREQASAQAEFPVRPFNPFYTRVTDTTAQDQPVVLTPEKIGLPGTNSATLAFTRIPDIQLQKRFKRVIRYPYGCLEQTVSTGMAQLYIDNVMDVSEQEAQAIQNNITQTIDKLPSFQIKQGFSFWPVNEYYKQRYSDWGSIYAGHFLVLAEQLGYHIPASLLRRWRQSAQSQAGEVREDHRYQAYRLYVLSLAGHPHHGAMNLMRETLLPELDPLSQSLLAAAYALSGEQAAANDIQKQIDTSISPYREMSGTFGSVIRDQALMTCCALDMQDVKAAAGHVRAFSKQFSATGWYSTHDIGSALLASSKFYAQSSLSQGSVEFSVQTGDNAAKDFILNDYQMSMDVSDAYAKAITVTPKSDAPLFITLFEEGIPLKDIIPAQQQGVKLARAFYGKEGHEISVEALSQGQPFWVRYQVINQSGNPLEELALSSLLPAGWEIINPRLTQQNLPTWIQSYNPDNGEYMDIRDDRVNWFFDLHRGQKNFFIQVNPTFAGTYTLPPVTVEAMYSPEVSAAIESGEVEVKPAF
ncbi:MAG: MG2 domain-containing protein [candidate division KSB1 bacterium]|nr:MG2 domain-containing protein [candidate division KSB1 bacterium]